MIKSITFQYVAIMLILLAILAMPISVDAQTVTRPRSLDPVSLVDYVLCTMGLGCGSAQPISQITTTTSTNTSVRTANIYSSGVTSSGATSSGNTNSGGGLFGFGRSAANTQAVLYGATIAKNYTKNEITLVRIPRADSVPGVLQPNENIYEIIRGKKHLIPNLDIFFDYGFKAQQVQFISQTQLDKYPRIKIVQVVNDKNKFYYYITEVGSVRKVLPEKSKDILESYGDRSEDIITISKKEFNYYPENKYIHLEQPRVLDAYIIIGSTKRYLTPAAIRRMNVLVIQVAPVNEVEFNAYMTGDPIIY